MTTLGIRALQNAVFIVAVCSGYPAEGQDSISTLSNALIATYTTNAQIAAQVANLKQVKEEVAKARTSLFPSISLSTDIGRTQRIVAYEPAVLSFLNAEATQTPGDVSISVTESLYHGGGIIAGINGALAQVRAEEQNTASVEQKVLGAAATAYYDVVRDTALLELVIQNENNYRSQIDWAMAIKNAGQATATDVAQATARYAESQANRREAERSLRKSRSQLEALTGRPAGPAMSADTDVTINIPSSLAEAMNIADEASPTLLSSQFAIDVARSSLVQAQAAFRPAVTLSLSDSYSKEPYLVAATATNPSKSHNVEAQIKVTIPLFQGGLEYSNLRSAILAGQQAIAVAEDARRSTEADAKSAWEDLTSAREITVITQKEVSADTSALEGVKREVLAGTRTVLDALNAERELAGSKIKLLNAEHDAHIAAIHVASVTGRFTAEALGIKP